MEHQLWKAIVALARAPVQPPRRRAARFTFTDADIVGVFYWAVIHDRPVAWACQARHWPPHRRRCRLPSGATMSRRLRAPAVRALLAAVEGRVTAPARPGGLFW